MALGPRGINHRKSENGSTGGLIQLEVLVQSCPTVAAESALSQISGCNMAANHPLF